MRWIHQRGYDYGRGIPFLREVHGFVLDKPGRIRAKLVAGGVPPRAFEAPGAVDEADLAAIHTPEVLAGLKDAGALATAVELPPLARLPAALVRHMVVRPQLLASGGTALAMRLAAAGHWVANLGGGFHHARPDLSHGFCLVNDVAWGVHCLRRDGDSSRVLVLDLDLHQGDGNAEAFQGRDDVFTASLHQEDTFPIPKATSDLDVGLVGGTVSDAVYRDALDDLLAQVAERFAPQIVVHVAGTDVHEDDGIGSFGLTADGVVARDRRVARFAAEHGAGLVVLPAGGYSRVSPELAAAGFAAVAEVDAQRTG